jgi:hypothetical protein
MITPFLWVAYVVVVVLWLCGIGPIAAVAAWWVFLPLVLLTAWALFWLVCWVFGWVAILFFIFLDIVFG